MSAPNRHGRPAADRLELELSAWLAGFEPASTPIALRLRTYADLRDQAARRPPRLAGLRPALSLAGSALIIGGTAFALMALVALGGAVDRGAFGGPTGQPGTAEPTSNEPYAVMSLIVAAVGVLAGASLYFRFIRRAFVQLTFGASTATPGALLSLRRPWRSVGWAKVALAALTFVTAILAALQCLDYTHTGLVADAVVDRLFLELGMAPLGLLIVWRYPLRDRPTRLLLAGALLSLVYLWAGYATFWLPDLWYQIHPDVWELLVYDSLPMAALVVLVAGLAARLDVRAGPPIALAALFVALGFMETRFAEPADATMPLLTQLTWIIEGLSQWFMLLAWLAAAWIGFAGFRRTRSRAWLIMLGAGMIGASGYGSVYLASAGVLVGFSNTGAQATWMWLMDLASAWYRLTMALAQVGLLVALAVGLRPVVVRSSLPDDAPRDGVPVLAVEGADTAPPTNRRTQDLTEAPRRRRDR